MPRIHVHLLYVRLMQCLQFIPVGASGAGGGLARVAGEAAAAWIRDDGVSASAFGVEDYDPPFVSASVHSVRVEVASRSLSHPAAPRERRYSGQSHFLREDNTTAIDPDTAAP